MRTQDEIVARIEAVKPNDFLGFQASVLIGYLDFAHAKPYLKPDTPEVLWQAAMTEKTPREELVEYMPFAWEKANNCRGLSAGRSVEKCKAWLWLDGKEKLADGLDSIYEYYGKPCLVVVCAEYGIEWRALDDKKWRNSEDEEGVTVEVALNMIERG